MPLQPGARLGPYEILSALGAGGMGEVYKARDTRLDRVVAIKILPETLAADPQFRERFEREARAISQLTHAHICTLHDIGRQDLTDFLVMEHLEGETLAERLTKGALPLDQALTIAIQIAGALDHAHRAGIVHRDLKPGNIMLTKTGASAARQGSPQAKLLDFGLAKASSANSGGPAKAGHYVLQTDVPRMDVRSVRLQADLSATPTMTSPITAQGTILGTFQYMAPEQLEGQEADARTDIFAFGAVLYEMLTGKKAFEGKSHASLISAIMSSDPKPVSALQPLTPPTLDRLVGTCLAKEPDDRYQSARDLFRDLTWVASGSSESAASRTVTPPARSNRVAWLVAALATIALVAVAVVSLRRTGEVTPAAGPVQFTIVPPDNTSFGGPIGGGTGVATQVAVSPDGRNIVFVAGAQSAYQIWLRPIAALAARPIPGTEGGTFPFWSPDSRFVGFFAAGKLKKVQIAGGPPIVLCDAPAGRGGSWSRDNVILFTPGGAVTGLQRVSSVGGVPTVVTTVDQPTGDTRHRWPHFLPDGRHFMYTEISGPGGPASKPSMIRIGSLDQADTASTLLLQADSSVSYASGHVLFARDETLMAQPFDPDTRQTTGDGFPLAQRVSTEGSRYVGASVSENGTLVYARDDSLAATQLTWLDRAGRALATLGEAAPYINLALSPDERRAAVALGTGNPENLDVWIIDIARNVRSRLTVDPGTDWSPVWSPDGTRIAFEGRRSGKVSLRQQLINGTAADELLLEGSDGIRPSGWSADGRFIAYTLTTGRFPPKNDAWVLPVFGDRKPFPLAQTAFDEISGEFSPDGRWIAYTTDEAGQPNVTVQPFLRAGGKHQVSRDGGSHPVWRADGKELFYLRPDGTLMAVPIDTTGHFDAGEPQALFLTGAPRPRNFRVYGQVYAVTKDGQRFLVNARPQQSSVAPLTVVVNWTATIQK